MIAAVHHYADNPSLASERELALSRPKTEWVSRPWEATVLSSGTYGAPSFRAGSLPGVSFLLSAILVADDQPFCSLTTPEVPAALDEIRDGFSLNTAQLSTVLQVTRQTIYNWGDGKPVETQNRRRISAVRELALTWLREHGKPMGPIVAEEFDGESLLSLLRAEVLDERAIFRKFEAIADRSAAVEANRPPSARELAAKFGLEPLSEEEHRRNLTIAGLRYGRGK